MIGLDTNVLLRYVVKDDPTQFAIAERIIDAAADRGETFVIGDAVLCEFAWVLARLYRYTHQEIADALDDVVTTAGFHIDRIEEVRAALAEYRTTGADFADALIGRVHRLLGAEHTLTFDRNLKALDSFRVL